MVDYDKVWLCVELHIKSEVVHTLQAMTANGECGCKSPQIRNHGRLKPEKVLLLIL